MHAYTHQYLFLVYSDFMCVPTTICISIVGLCKCAAPPVLKTRTVCVRKYLLLSVSPQYVMLSVCPQYLIPVHGLCVYPLYFILGLCVPPVLYTWTVCAVPPPPCTWYSDCVRPPSHWYDTQCVYLPGLIRVYSTLSPDSWHQCRNIPFPQTS